MFTFDDCSSDFTYFRGGSVSCSLSPSFGLDVLQSLRKLLYQVKGFKASAVCFSRVKNSKQFLVLTKWVNKISFPGFLNLKDFFSMQYLIRST